MRQLPDDGLERRRDVGPDGRVYYRLVETPRAFLLHEMNDGREVSVVEVPCEPPPRRRHRDTSWEDVIDAAGPLALIVGLAAFWLILSYVVMVAGWVLGAGGIHPFPHVLLIPHDNCSPSPHC